MFGSGLQYVFLSTLLFAYAKDGVVLIDEVENGIHYGLMSKYSLFLHKLAEKFNVQLFISSHSDECINSFINNNYKTNDIVGYHTYSDDSDNLQARRVSGSDLKKYISNFGFDLRGESK